MKSTLIPILLVSVTALACNSESNPSFRGLPEDLIHTEKDSIIISDTIVYHPVRINQNGKLLPWYSVNQGESYDFVLKKVWEFWKNIETDSNGQKYYLNHQVWWPNHDRRGLGGDQLNMALSSWDLYYNYTGDESVKTDMKYIADYYLENSMSSNDSEWPNLPFPYNMNVESGVYDGDMILGKDFLQPDKAGSFGFELVHLYKKTGDEKYLNAAVKIATTLAARVKPGDADHSPWPFKVNARTGETGILVDQEIWYEGMDKDLNKTNKGVKQSGYTTFWTGTLGLFSELIQLKKGDSISFQKAFDITIRWMLEYPAKTNKWGPFFEDVPRWSDTQINATTFAMYLMEHPELDKNWKTTVANIFEWVYKVLSNREYEKYGVVCINEQTAYPVPGNSHSARQASMDLLYWKNTGDTSRLRNAVRQLNWATYMVDSDGKNFYPTNAVWMTDGYGDYVRHYLRAMAAAPQLAPEATSHLLQSSSIVQTITYKPKDISYTTYDRSSEELLRLVSKPKRIEVNDMELKHSADQTIDGWTWESLPKGGVCKIRHSAGNNIRISL